MCCVHDDMKVVGFSFVDSHELQQGIKIKPIVSNINGPTIRLSWLISNLLKPMLKTIPAHLGSSLELINYIQTRDRELNQQFCYPVSLDVTALYTSVPTSEAIDNVIKQITSPIETLTNEDTRAQLTVILQNTYFPHDSNIYLQIEGLPMGSSLSGTLAILFMDKLERNVLTLHRLTDPYKRYVAQTINDVYAQTINEAEAHNQTDSLVQTDRTSEDRFWVKRRTFHESNNLTLTQIIFTLISI